MRYKALFFLVMLNIVLSSCVPNPALATHTPLPAPITETPVKTITPQWLHFGIDTSGINTLDPHIAATRQERILVDMVFNGLIRYKPGNMPALEPDLAIEMPEASLKDGKQVWEVRLRQGVMCQPGPLTDAYELTADDVVYSLQRSADPNRSAYAGEYADMQFQVIDKYSLSITLDTPQSVYLFLPKIENYSGGFIVCKQAVEAMGSQAFSEHPVGTGPFIFQEYIPTEKISLIANPSYFRGTPRLLGVETFFLPDLSEREKGLSNGSLDVIVGSNASGWTSKWVRDDILIDIIGVGQPIVLHFNPSFSPLQDVRVRKAIAYSIDRNEVQALFDPLTAKNIYSIVPPEFLPGGLTKAEVNALGLEYAQNLDQARALLNEAGYPNGFTLPVVASKLEVLQKIYANLELQLAQVGIELQIESVDHTMWHQMIREDKSALVVYGGWRPNADIFLTQFFDSSTIVVSGSNPDTNFSHYDQIDDLIVGARNELNSIRQVELWKQAQVKILADMVALPLEYQNLVYIRRTSVDYGYTPVASLALYPQFTELTQIFP